MKTGERGCSPVSPLRPAYRKPAHVQSTALSTAAIDGLHDQAAREQD